MTAGTNGGYVHGAFGLRVRSVFDLPEFPRRADDGSSADVVIERASLHDRLEGAVRVDPAMQVSPTGFQLDAPAGRFRVGEGRRILVDPRSGAVDADLRPYLLGTAMGALCHQRALLPLHAAGVLVGGRAVAFAGPSGAGKSTLAAQFHARGYDVLADDLLAVEIEPEGTPRALPGAARIRLRTRSPESAAPAAADGKLSLPVASPTAARAWPVRQLYLLRTTDADTLEVCRLRGPEAVSAIVDHVYRWPIAAAMGRGAACFAQCLALATRCDVFEVSFTHATNSPVTLFRALDTHLSP